MGSSTCCAAAANGASSRATTARGPQPTTIFAAGGWMARGSRSMPNCALARLHAGRDPTPSAAIIDSQSVKTLMGGLRGYDGNKKLVGRKRHILVDTEGFLYSVVA